MVRGRGVGVRRVQAVPKINQSKVSVRHTGTVDPEAERLCVFKPPPGLQRREQQGRATALCLFNSKSEGAAVRSVEKELARWEKWEGGQSGGGGGVVGGFEDPSCRRRRGSSWGLASSAWGGLGALQAMSGCAFLRMDP